MTAMLVRGMQGLGDNIYARAVIRELPDLSRVYLETPWPQLYSDLPIKCVPRVTKLRTQSKNASRTDLTWHTPPPGLAPRNVHYVHSKGTMLQGLCDAFGVQPARVTFDLPTFAPDRERPPYIVIRPATVRAEWPASSRNPRPEYLALAAEKLREHFHIVSVADLVQDVEWPELPLPYADETLHRGELQVEQLMALIAGAAGVVSGVGWAVPACVAYHTPLFLIYGGWAKANGPQRIFDSRMPTGNVHEAIPQRFCGCDSRDHACDKTIQDADRRVGEWMLGLLSRE